MYMVSLTDGIAKCMLLNNCARRISLPTEKHVLAYLICVYDCACAVLCGSVVLFSDLIVLKPGMSYAACNHNDRLERMWI